jgi:hypothetical protein
VRLRKPSAVVTLFWLTLSGASLGAATAPVYNNSFSFPATFNLDSRSAYTTLDTLAATQDQTALKSLLTALHRENPEYARWFGSTNEVVAIFVIWDKTKPPIAVDEEPRTTEFARGLKTLVQIAEHTVGILGAAQPPPPIRITKATYKLVDVRATLTIKTLTDTQDSQENSGTAAPTWVIVLDATSKAGQDAADAAEKAKAKQHAADPNAPATPDSTPAPLSARVVTGPREHLFWSASVPLNKVSELQLDPTTNTLKERADPGAFFAGLNYSFADPLDTSAPVLSQIFIGAMLKVSKSPLDAFGYYVGLKGSTLSKIGLDLDFLTVAVGQTFTLQDTKSGGGRKAAYRVILGFDIDKALSWATTPKSTSSKPASS